MQIYNTQENSKFTNLAYTMNNRENSSMDLADLPIIQIQVVRSDQFSRKTQKSLKRVSQERDNKIENTLKCQSGPINDQNIINHAINNTSTGIKRNSLHSAASTENTQFDNS